MKTEKFYIGVALCLAIIGAVQHEAIVTLAHAQQPEKEFNLKLSVSVIQVISDALAEMPYKKAAIPMQIIQTQINQQLATPEPKTEEGKPTKGE